MTELESHIYYRDDTVVVYLGDNRMILPLIQEESVDVVVTSPPYNTSFVGNNGVKPSGMMKESSMAKWVEKMTSGYEDALPEPEYQDQQVEVLNAIGRVLAPHGSCFYNHKIRWREKRLLHPLTWVSRSDLHLRMEIVWDRGVGTALNARMYYLQDERMYWLYKHEWRWNQSAVGLGSVWRIPPQAFREHSCVFPEKLVGNCLAGVIRPGDTVLDPYAGSGTTLVVARRFGCKAIGIESQERYCQVIVDRLSQQVMDFDQAVTTEAIPLL